MKRFSLQEINAVQGWYFLREGDFLPEMVGGSKYHHDGMMLQIFKENGVLFEKREDAIQAGNAIRAFLLGNQLSLVSKELHRKHNRLTAEEVSQVFHNLLEESLCDNDRHTQSTEVGRSDAESNSPQTVLIKIFHS